jgi:hypothetical protein
MGTPYEFEKRLSGLVIRIYVQEVAKFIMESVEEN